MGFHYDDEQIVFQLGGGCQQCKTCKYREPDYKKITGYDKVTCQKYLTVDNCKPSGVMKGSVDCEFYTKE